jgi:hypothetical protein
MSHSLRTLPHWCRATRIVGAIWLAALGTSGCSPEPPPQLGSYRVLATTRRSTTTLIELRTDAERLLTTPDHLFARSTGWARADELKVGDEIETAQGRTRLSALRTLQVGPTAVYNLTIDKTHAYFAGRAALLVHNVDCTAPKSPPEQLAEQRRREERERQHAEQVERDARELRLRRLLDAHKRRNARVTLNDSPRGTPNCGYCTVAALNDTKKLSEFLRQHGFDEHSRPPEAELHHMMQVLGLSDHSSAAPRVFERYELAEQWQRLLSRGVDRYHMSARRYESMMPERPARAYMESLPGNTNMVVYRWVERVEEPRGSGQFTTKNMGHALTSVRREGGEIVYVDFQQVPPAIFEKLPTTSYDVVVIPTTVDWRYNRQLYAALRDGEVYASL